ncbi:MAG: MEDS domain-containing protein [Chloroflexi bacterium]|nr:MEDS domain-containing protein [Chloroflexota bacterium]
MITDVDRPIHIAGGVLTDVRHVCCLVDGMDEARQLLGSYVAEGVDDGQRSFHIVNPTELPLHLEWLESLGVDVDGLQARSRLDVKTWDETYLQGGRFDQERWIERLATTLDDFDRTGFPVVRLMADMEWALQDRPGVGDLVEYEYRANAVLAQHKHIGCCIYNLRKFMGDVIMDIVRTHPLVIVGGVLHQNPFFTQSPEFVSELRQRRSAA